MTRHSVRYGKNVTCARCGFSGEVHRDPGEAIGVFTCECADVADFRHGEVLVDDDEPHLVDILAARPPRSLARAELGVLLNTAALHIGEEPPCWTKGSTPAGHAKIVRALLQDYVAKRDRAGA